MKTIDIYISSIDAGDTIILPGETEQRRVIRTWFVLNTREWMVQVHEGINGRDDIYTFHSSDVRKATLVDRPGFGPFRRTYEIGDRVYYRFGNRDNQFGVVVGFDENPLDPDDRAYEIRSATSTGYAGPESMRIVDQPAFAVGQRWRCMNGQSGTILQTDEIGLICEMRLDGNGNVARYVLSAPFWTIEEDAPEA